MLVEKLIFGFFGRKLTFQYFLSMFIKGTLFIVAISFLNLSESRFWQHPYIKGTSNYKHQEPNFYPAKFHSLKGQHQSPNSKYRSVSRFFKRNFQKRDYPREKYTVGPHILAPNSQHSDTQVLGRRARMERLEWLMNYYPSF